jgi:hypothetical protein
VSDGDSTRETGNLRNFSGKSAVRARTTVSADIPATRATVRLSKILVSGPFASMTKRHPARRWIARDRLIATTNLDEKGYTR